MDERPQSRALSLRVVNPAAIDEPLPRSDADPFAGIEV
jgi:hypothetical protein